MTQVYDALARDSTWAQLGFHNGIDKFLTLDLDCLHISDRIMATAMEAVLGALLRDSGSDIKAVEAAMVKLGCFDLEK